MEKSNVLLAAAAILLVTAACSGTGQVRDRPWLHAAQETARWLESVAREGNQGKAWPADPDKPVSLSPDLYSGTAGVVLFFLEMYAATNDASYLHLACDGAEYLAAAVPDSLDRPEQAGLYTGVAGIGFTLEEVFRVSKRPAFRRAAMRCVELLEESARRAGRGVEWGPVTDIISGSAGVGLFLLHAAREMGHEPARELAIAAGRRLVDLAIPDRGGLKWAMDPAYPRLMPNFSHGTAGVCFFLLRLHSERGEKEFLDAALAGARYLRKSAEGNGLIFHHEPGGEDLFYLGWCHGPAGTAQLYCRLFEQTGDALWLDAVHEAAQAVMRSGIPERQTPGYWNNVGRCCGHAGVADFFLFLHEETGRTGYLEFAKRLTADLLARGTPGKEGLKWIHAEHRVKPDLVAAQTGLMQGAAGIGIWLLRLDGFETGRKRAFVLPDSAWRSRCRGLSDFSQR